MEFRFKKIVTLLIIFYSTQKLPAAWVQPFVELAVAAGKL
jgi:hypothetical protein